jgi:hypothetical protein
LGKRHIGQGAYWLIINRCTARTCTVAACTPLLNVPCRRINGIFDASNRDQCEVKRLRTNTPLQALVMLNDPTVLEARVLAARLLQDKSPGKDKLIKSFPADHVPPSAEKE